MVIKWLMIVLGVLLTAGTAVFVAGEFALVALDPSVVDAPLRPEINVPGEYPRRYVTYPPCFRARRWVLR